MEHTDVPPTPHAPLIDLRTWGISLDPEETTQPQRHIRKRRSLSESRPGGENKQENVLDIDSTYSTRSNRPVPTKL